MESNSKQSKMSQQCKECFSYQSFNNYVKQKILVQQIDEQNIIYNDIQNQVKKLVNEWEEGRKIEKENQEGQGKIIKLLIKDNQINVYVRIQNQEIIELKEQVKKLGQENQELRYKCKIGQEKLLSLSQQHQALHKQTVKDEDGKKVEKQYQQQIEKLTNKLLQLQNDLKQAKQSINIIQIPTEVIQNIPKIELRQIPVYIEKQIIKEVPVPLFIKNSMEMVQLKDIIEQNPPNNIKANTHAGGLQQMARKCQSFDNRINEQSKEDSPNSRAEFINFIKGEESISKIRPSFDQIDDSSIYLRNSQFEEKEIYLIQIPLEVQINKQPQVLKLKEQDKGEGKKVQQLDEKKLEEELRAKISAELCLENQKLKEKIHELEMLISGKQGTQKEQQTKSKQLQRTDKKSSFKNWHQTLVMSQSAGLQNTTVISRIGQAPPNNDDKVKQTFHQKLQDQTHLECISIQTQTIVQSTYRKKELKNIDTTNKKSSNYNQQCKSSQQNIHISIEELINGQQQNQEDAVQKIQSKQQDIFNNQSLSNHQLCMRKIQELQTDNNKYVQHIEEIEQKLNHFEVKVIPQYALQAKGLKEQIELLQNQIKNFEKKKQFSIVQVSDLYISNEIFQQQLNLSEIPEEIILKQQQYNLIQIPIQVIQKQQYIKKTEKAANKNQNEEKQYLSNTQEVGKQVQRIQEVVKYVDRPIQVIKEIIIEKPVQVIKYVDRPIEAIKEVIKQIVVEKPVQVVKYVDKPIQVIKEVIKQVEIQKPVQIIKYVDKPIEIIKEVIKQVEIQKPVQVIKYVDKPIQVIKEVIKQVEIQKPVQVIKYVDKPIEVVKEVIKQIVVQKPVQIIKYVDRPIEVVKEVIKQVEVQKPVQVVKYIERPVQVVKEVIKQVEVQKAVQVIKFIYIDKQTPNTIKSSFQSSSIDHDNLETVRNSQQYNVSQSNYQTQLLQKISHLQAQLDAKNQTVADLQRDKKLIELQLNDSNEQFKLFETNKTYLQTQIQNLTQHLQHQNKQLRFQKQESNNIKKSLQKIEKTHKRDLNQLKLQYEQIITCNQDQINQLKNQMECLIKQYQDKINDIKEQMDQTQLVAKLEEQNGQMKNVIEMLNHQIQDEKRKKNNLIKQMPFQQNCNQNNEKITKVKLRNQRKLNQGTIKISQKLSKIRIQDINQKQNDNDVVGNLTNIVNQYSQQLEQKNRQILQLNKAISYYQQTMNRIQCRNMNSYSFVDQQKFNRSNYTNSILRKLSLCEYNLEKEREQKIRCKGKIQQLEKQLQNEALIPQKINRSYEVEDSQLFERVVVALQNQKKQNGLLKSEITKLKKSVHCRNKNHSQIAGRRDHPLIFNPTVNSQVSLSLLDNESLMRQVKIYRAEYYKVLDINRQLTTENNILKEKLRGLGDCSSYRKNISFLKRKVDDYENHVIPQLKLQIKTLRKNCQNSSQNQQLNKARKLHKLTNTAKIPQVSSKRGKVWNRSSSTQEFHGSTNNNNNKTQSSKRQLPNTNPTTNFQYLANNFRQAMKTKMSIQLKYILSKKLLQYGKTLTTSQSIQNIYPQNILISQFSQNTAQKMVLSKTEHQVKYQDHNNKLYQAPEILVGEQCQSQKSLIWTIGIIIDELFVGKNYYQKFSQILTDKNNYCFKGERDMGKIGKLLEKIIVKDQNKRLNFQQAIKLFANVAPINK